MLTLGFPCRGASCGNCLVYDNRVRVGVTRPKSFVAELRRQNFCNLRSALFRRVPTLEYGAFFCPVSGESCALAAIIPSQTCAAQPTALQRNFIIVSSPNGNESFFFAYRYGIGGHYCVLRIFFSCPASKRVTLSCRLCHIRLIENIRSGYNVAVQIFFF